MHRAGGDGGFTLVEVVVTIVLLGLAVAGTLGALDASVSGSARHREHAQALAYLQSASDVLTAPGLVPLQPCSVPVTQAAAAYRQALAEVPGPEGWSLPEVAVQYWDGDGFGSACPVPDPGVQLLTLSVTSPTGDVTKQLEVVKSDAG